MNKQTIYLAGPMRGFPRYNFAAFTRVCEQLRAMGYKVLSPHEIDLVWGFDPDIPHKEQTVAMIDMVRRDVEAIGFCDMVVLLPGWRKSVGARAEVAIAKWLKKPVINLSQLKK
jgi:nucleoside 2-deoxyribosyltransferase